MFLKCSNCDFFIVEDAAACPDCGLLAPQEDFQDTEDKVFRNLSITLGLVLGIIFTVVVSYLRTDGKFDNGGEFFGLLVGGALVGFAFAVFIAGIVARKIYKSERNKRLPETQQPTFAEIESAALQGKAELEEEFFRIEDFLSQKSEFSGSESVKNARQKITRLLARFNFIYAKVSFARMMNNLLPMLSERDFTKKNFMQSADSLVAEIDGIEETVRACDLSEMSLQTIDEKEVFLTQLSDIRTFLGNFRESFLKGESREKFTVAKLKTIYDEQKFLAKLSRQSKSTERIFENFLSEYSAIEKILKR